MIQYYIYRDNDPDNEKRTILDRAHKKFGGQTTVWRVAQEVKAVSQRYGVSDAITIAPSPGKGLKITFLNPVITRLEPFDTLKPYLRELQEAIYDCGYGVTAGDDFFEVFKV
jgi:hypothetical protein